MLGADEGEWGHTLGCKILATAQECPAATLLQIVLLLRETDETHTLLLIHRPRFAQTIAANFTHAETITQSNQDQKLWNFKVLSVGHFHTDCAQQLSQLTCR